MKDGFIRVELNRTVWEVPERYTNLQPVGAGAYGQVWYGNVYVQNCLELNHFNYFFHIYSSAIDSIHGTKVAIKKLARPFQSAIHAKRTYREIRLLKHMNHENVSENFNFSYY